MRQRRWLVGALPDQRQGRIQTQCAQVNEGGGRSIGHGR